MPRRPTLIIFSTTAAGLATNTASADAHKPLTTQLYFKGDPWIGRDPFVRKSLIIELQKTSGTFDIVLAKA